MTEHIYSVGDRVRIKVGANRNVGTASIVPVGTHGEVTGCFYGGVIVKFDGYPGDGACDGCYVCALDGIRLISPLEQLAECAE